MKKKNPRRIALSLLNKLSNNPAFSNRVIKSYFDRCPELGERDKAFILNIVQGVIRWRLRLNWIIARHISFPFEKLDSYVLNILLISVYQIFFMERVPEFAIVNEAVELAKRRGKHVSKVVNAVLRNICRNRANIEFPDREKEPISFLSIFYSYPEWLVRKWINEMGLSETEALLRAQNNPPRLTLRTNRMRISRYELMLRLRQEGVNVSPTEYSPDGIIVEKQTKPISDMEAYREDLFAVQDEASQLCSYIIDPHPGDMILDVCAGMGSKSFHMAQLFKKKGKIIALDINTKRLLILAQTSRAQAMDDVIHCVVGDGCYTSSILKKKFDKILLDAPCSGLGTISRHPDIKWTKTEKDIERLSHTQKKMLNEAVKLLKKGGRMLYVTCTISREENDMVVDSFLEEQSGKVRLLNIATEIPWLKDLVDKRGFFRTYPHRHEMDGFFCALFSRQY